MRTLLIVTVAALAQFACAPHPAPPPPPIEVGLASRDITPPLGYRLAGYFYERLATAVHDPLHAKAIVFKQADVRFALVLCDLCQTSPEVVSQARTLASEKTGIPPEHICIASTHTHTGPDYFGVLAQHLHELALGAHNGQDPARPIDYPNLLADRIAEAIVEANASASPATLAFGSAPQPNVAFNRRYFLKDGTVAWNPGKQNPKVDRPAGPIDPYLAVLTVRRQDNLAAILTNFPMHPDTAGGTEYSADYPFYIESTLRTQLHQPDLVSLFAQGTSGNINHIDVSTTRPQSGQAETQRIGSAIAQRVIDTALPSARPLRYPSLAVGMARLDLPVQQYAPDEVAQARGLFATIQDRKLPFLVGVKSTKIVKLYDRHHGQPIPAQVQVLRLSDDAAIVMVPSELFVEFGLAIKQQSPFQHTLVIELANDSFGYVPTRQAFAQGAYEPTNSVLAPGAGELIADTALRLLHGLKN